MEKIKLSSWAKEQDKTYKEAWRMVQSGNFPEKIERDDKNRILVVREAKVKKSAPRVSFATPVGGDLIEPTKGLLGNKRSSNAARRNKAATLQRTDEYYHIDSGVDPFLGSNGDRSSSSNDSMSVRDTIILTQKAYWNFSEFKNIIDVMTEFSSNKIFFRGGTKKARDFCKKLFDSVQLLKLQDCFFREFYRSGNVCIYKYEGGVTQEDIVNLNRVYGSSMSKAVKKIFLPIRYTVLNPANIVAGGNISFSHVDFYQRLTPYEIQRLQYPKTDDDKNFLKSLPLEIQKQITNSKGVNGQVDIPLSPRYAYMVFNKKQDYEPMAVPMGWPVLKDLNWKAEMKAIDMAVARTTQRVVLLITMGFESKEGEYMVDPKILQATKELFDSESVGKVLVADWTTKAEFVVPDIANILDPKKYAQVNEDIRSGLNNILVGDGEKFANQSIKVKLFIERLQQSRETFLEEFLKPEIKNICKEMGFRKFPEPFFEELELKDQDIFNRLVTRLTEIGVLTAEECFEAMESGRLPTGEESAVSQLKYKELRDSGMYEPLIGGGKGEQMEGRPPGTKAPQTTKKIKPSKANYSAQMITENMVNAAQLFKDLKEKACAKYKIKKLTIDQEEVMNLIAEQIVINEDPLNWSKSISKYLRNPDIRNEDRYNEVVSIANEHQVTDFVAGILQSSRKSE